MKRNWLLYLVIFSLALNLGTIGTLAYLHYQERQRVAAREALPPLPLRELWGQLHLNDTQRQALRHLFPEHRRQVRELRIQLAQKRLELFDLIKSPAPSREAVQAKVKEISALQGNLEEEMARFLLEFKKQLQPGQETAFLQLMQGRLGRALGPWGPGGPHRHGPRHGDSRWGDGPGPPPPPGGPGGPGAPGCPPGGCD